MQFATSNVDGGGLIDFDDVSVVVDGFWSAGCRGLSLICGSATRLTHKFSTSRVLLDFYVQCLFRFVLLLRNVMT